MDPVREFFKDVWKIAAGCAAGAFVLSLLIGLIAGNPFGIAFSRALFLALLFAALGAGLRAVVRAYLPELSAGAAPAADGPGARSGSVDIVVPDDEALRRQAYQGGGRPAPDAQGGAAEPGEELVAVGEEGPAGADAGPAEELPEELAEELPPQERSGESAALAGEEVSEAEVVEESWSADDLLSEPATADLDALPDIEDLEPPAAPAGRPPAARRPSRLPPPRVGETPEEAMRSFLGSQDPATLARAIRTSLKKDEKG
jgi:hypothetical protein